MKKILLLLMLGTSILINTAAQSLEKSNFFITSIEMNVDDKPSIHADSYLQMMQSRMNLSAEIDFKKLKSNVDKLGNTHTKYNQTYKNVEIFGAQMIVHSKNNFIYFINGKIANHISLETIPTITAEEAIAAAKNSLHYKNYIWENESLMKRIRLKNKTANFYPKPELCIIDASNNGNPKLCWQFILTSGNLQENYKVFIDCTNATIVKKIEQNNMDVSCSGPTRYNGIKTFKGSFDATANGYVYFTDASYGPSISQEIETVTANYDPTFSTITDIYNTTTTFTDDTAANSVHWGMDKTYNFYSTTFNRNSFDDLGSPISNVVHVDIGYNNANWIGGLQGFGIMQYGDGDGINYNQFVNIDITGHELSHGVTQYSAALIYEGESGALNESFSDIMGVGTEHFALGNLYNWKIGEGLQKTGISHLRNLENPKNTQTGSEQPDTYMGSFWINTVGCTPDATNDNCGVHINSGVGNYWFYLIAMGDTGTNDKGFKYGFAGMGIDKALKIAYKMQTEYLTNTSEYADAVIGSKQAVTDLHGANSIELDIVKKAWCAVNLGSNCVPLSTSNFHKIANPSIYPNPNNGSFTIGNIDETYQYKLTNTIGSILAVGEVTEINNTVQLHNMPSGIYYLQLSNRENRISKKIIIQ
jgi:Zn-dependent metalloprotease